MKGSIQSIGLEVENAWIKAVVFGPDGPRARQYDLPLRGDPPRHLGERDLEAGLIDALERLKLDLAADPASSTVAVAASCHFAFPSFRRAHDALVSVLAHHLPHARLAGIDRLYALWEAAASPSPLRFVLSRSLGIRTLGRACGPLALAIDCGTTSTEAVWCESDPPADPDADSLDRLRDGRLTWIGALQTPLDFVVDRAGTWPLVPRMARMGAVAALCMPDAAVMDEAMARKEVAQAVGLDDEILGHGVGEIAREVRQAAIARLAASFREVIGARSFQGEVGIMGVGSEFLARPALAACGIGRVVDLEARAGVPSNFGAALGLALAAGLG